MTRELSSASLNDFPTRHARLAESLYEESKGARWGLSRESFARHLQLSSEKRFRGATPNLSELDAYLRSLHLEDLALACACSEGIESAWEFFVAHFREDLRGAARAILRTSGSGNDARAEELADSLYAELYGIRIAADGRRKSLFEYFHGRSKLSTWLRAVLAQRHVDLLRADRATVSLDGVSEGSEDGPPLEIAQQTYTHPADPRRAEYLAQVDCALQVALASLTPRERMLLACYYVDQLTLAEIGRTLREHESTVSRQLERTRRTLRELVTERLRRGVPARDGRDANPGLDESQVELAFEYVLEDWPFDLSRALSNADLPEKQTRQSGEPLQGLNSEPF